MRRETAEILEEARAFYFRNVQADVLQAQRGGIWGAFWTIPPARANAMEKAGRQMTRSRVERVRHLRRARLRRRVPHDQESVNPVEVIILTELPSREQAVIRLSDGLVLQVEIYLEDEALKTLREAFTPVGVLAKPPLFEKRQS